MASGRRIRPRDVQLLARFIAPDSFTDEWLFSVGAQAKRELVHSRGSPSNGYRQ